MAVTRRTTSCSRFVFCLTNVLAFFRIESVFLGLLPQYRQLSYFSFLGCGNRLSQRLGSLDNFLKSDLDFLHMSIWFARFIPDFAYLEHVEYGVRLHSHIEHFISKGHHGCSFNTCRVEIASPWPFCANRIYLLRMRHEVLIKVSMANVNLTKNNSRMKFVAEPTKVSRRTIRL